MQRSGQFAVRNTSTGQWVHRMHDPLRLGNRKPIYIDERSAAKWVSWSTAKRIAKQCRDLGHPVTIVSINQ